MAKREKVVSIRLTAAEGRDLAERAQLAGMSLSDFIRDVLLRGGHRAALIPLPTIGSGTVSQRANIIWDNGECGSTLTLRNTAL